MVFSIDILMETTDLKKNGYEIIDNRGEDCILKRKDEPNIRYMGHFIDHTWKYIRLIEKYKTEEKKWK